MDGGILAGLVRPGARIAVADGCGSPRAAYPLLSALARERGDLRLVTGWLPGPADGLELDAFADARTIMPGWGLRRAADAGTVRAVPARLSAVPALLTGPLRPDLLVVAAAPTPVGPVLGSEVSWVRTVVDLGVPIAVVLDPELPRAAAGPPLPDEQVFVLGEVAEGPHAVPPGTPSAEHEAIGREVATLVPDGARLQWAPGQLGAAVVAGIREAGRRVYADSGLLGDGVVELDRAGLLLGDPVTTYLVGTPALYAWADERGRAGRPVLHRIEHSHDPGRLAGDPPLVSVNTAVEIDLDGQVNIEGTASALVGGIGGHPDYAAAATRHPRGLSIVAVASRHRGRSTRVETLSRPVSTAAHDVDVVVTEQGAADLRGLDRSERRRALDTIWV